MAEDVLSADGSNSGPIRLSTTVGMPRTVAGQNLQRNSTSQDVSQITESYSDLWDEPRYYTTSGNP